MTTRTTNQQLDDVTLYLESLPQQLTTKMRKLVLNMHRAPGKPFYELGAQVAKEAYEMGSSDLEVAKAQLARVEDFEIPARDGAQLAARLYADQPRGDAVAGMPLLLYLHGGGFTIGSINTHDILCRELARLSRCMVVSLDYRLAPEYQFPTAHNDAWDALQWLSLNGAGLGADVSRLAVAGDSAGGTLSTACAILARDAGLKLALQLLLYPGTDAHQSMDSHQRFAKGPLLDQRTLNWFFEQYLRSPADREDWRFAPLLAPDVDDVAPAWIGLAECDPLVDEGMAYADKLRMAGVPVDLEIYRGVTHEFIKMGRAVPEARQAHADMAAALRAAFGL